jgi:Uri superfamily endonuclease
VGRLGAFRFPSGAYIYTGSARGPGGPDARLTRHLAGPVRYHWHIDYLSAAAERKCFVVVAGTAVQECRLNRAVAELGDSQVVAPGFGSSDCGCESHLHFFEREVWPDFPGLEPWPAAGEESS